MALVNRDKDASEQKDVVTFTRLLAAAGSYMIWQAPYNFEVVAVAATARAISGAMTARVDINKFGGTNSASMMVALTVPAYGTSGAFVSASLAAAGSSFIQGAPKDSLWVVVPASVAADDLVLTVTVKKLQDIVSYNGA